MAVTIGTLTIDRLTAQPFGYEEESTRQGMVARSWAVSGLLKPSEWLQLLQVFESWRTVRLSDPDTAISLAVGTTVAFSGSFAGVSWSNVACWFSGAPQGSAAGAYIAASCELVDATEALALLIRSQEKDLEVEADAAPDYGTITLGNAVITLLDNPEGWGTGPSAAVSASGYLIVQGPLRPIRSKKVNGYTSEQGWADLKAWYESTARQLPVHGTYYPVSPPEMTKQQVVVGGVKTTRCNVSLELWEA